MGVGCDAAADAARAAQLADQLRLPLVEAGLGPRELPPGSAVLWVHEQKPALRLTGPRAPGPVGIDFASPGMAHRRRGGQNELLGRAVGWKAGHPPRVLDATAGLGRDAFVLADLGCDVLLCERQAVLALLLDVACRRAMASDDARLAASAARMRVYPGDVRQLGDGEIADRDVIYLDPMFPVERRALPSKELQVLQQLLASEEALDDPRGESLLHWARRQPVRRVVVKRPVRAPGLPGPAPGHQIAGKAIRFDVYPIAD